MRHWKKFVFEQLRDSWWVLAFWLACAAILERENARYHNEQIRLTVQLEELAAGKEKAEVQLQEMLREINSQSDPSWVEMTLLKELGMVPEGQLKVLFSDKQGH